NAKQHEREAYVVAQAGRKGAITVATNMAGRGTDIVLGGNPEMLARHDVLQSATEELHADPVAFDAAVKEATVRYKGTCEAERQEVLAQGGLHILGTERHESRRIDNQLRGRGGRQGDPGSSRFYLSLEDDLMRIFAGERIQVLMDRLGMEEDVPIEHKWVTKAVENAQTKVEQRNFDIRKNMLEYDDVMNQQRKSIYALRRQVLSGQYRSEPTKDERERGIEPAPLVEQADPHYHELVAGALENLCKMAAAPRVAADATPEQRQQWQKDALGASLQKLEHLDYQNLEQVIYVNFGCQTDLHAYEHNPAGCCKHLENVVPLSLTEQRERLFDLCDEVVGVMVEHACPSGKHSEDWDLDGLRKGFQEMFGIEGTGLDGVASAQDIAQKLYVDAEGVLKRREREVGELLYLRVLRNFYLQDIDNQWLEHLQNMEALRDGIGLRGYGQRDPKKEYQKEGFDLFLELTQNIKSNVVQKMFHFVLEREDEVERLEAERRRRVEARQAKMSASHAAAAAPQGDGEGEEAEDGDQAAAAGPASRRARRRMAAMGQQVEAQAAPKPQTVKRDKPKLGRNDLCWCGSQKKYKNCHLRSDEDAVA
ncbi:MAG: SEC-C metal-binding domain-containing protein, partial [Polyangiales bacterium]